jgi:hypothetical protein
MLTLQIFRGRICMSAADNAMSSPLEPEFDLDKHFLPAWAKQPSGQQRYSEYAGDTERHEPRRLERRDRPPRPKAPPQGIRNRPRHPEDRPRPRERRMGPEKSRPEPQALELPPINVAFVPEDKGVDSLARQIKMTGRAYPLFEIAQMILEKPERHSVTFTVQRDAQGAPLQRLYACALDDTLWLSEDEAVGWVLDRHFQTFYQPERTKIDPPKGIYTFVAQCGMSGVILGPPNYHGYQEALRKLHGEKFAKMSFENFKARVKIVREPEVVKKWLEERSWKTEYVCLNLPEAARLGSREEVEKHFRQVHLPNIIREVDTFHLSGVASRKLRQPALLRLLRQVWEQQRRFPLQVATVLSQQFAARGLQFFKVKRSITHVAVARPHFLDLDTTPVSDGVRKIVQYINEHPHCTRRQLMEALAPRAQPPAAEGPPVESARLEPTGEETQVIADLHWLVHQGHVTEFASGILETAKRPGPKQPQPTAAPAGTPPVPSEALPPASAISPPDVAAAPPDLTPAEAHRTDAGGDAPGPVSSPTLAVAEPLGPADATALQPDQPSVPALLPGNEANFPESSPGT